MTQKERKKEVMKLKKEKYHKLAFRKKINEHFEN